ncbi:MAG TPA: hypothetical protein VK186_09395, partial [Candidatus Deferrimicrobium sp.]|nr:hypothetical protein [Candidatus Deferrimicrobium sp.]
WSRWRDIGSPIYGSPSAVAINENRIEIFLPGSNSHIYRTTWDGRNLSDYEDLGGPFIGSPAVSSWGPDRLDVFAINNDKVLCHKYWS